jgi:hypothetical protein
MLSLAKIISVSGWKREELLNRNGKEEWLQLFEIRKLAHLWRQNTS